MGKLVRDTAAIDVPGSAGLFQWYAEAIGKLYDEVAPTAPGNLALVRREALGVGGRRGAVKLSAGGGDLEAGAGNSVVLKPAEQSPLSALRLAGLAVEAGLPAGVLNVVPGFGETAGRALGLHPDVDCLAFIGSTEVGKLFLGYSAQSNMKQVWLECGGKSPNLVFADWEDLDAAADMAVFGIFVNQGEVCSLGKLPPAGGAFHSQRLFRQAGGTGISIYARRSARSPIGHGGFGGPGAYRPCHGLYRTGRKTARLLTGGERVVINAGGCFVAPTIFGDVDPGDRLAREEIFGPVLSIIPFDGEDEPVARPPCCRSPSRRHRLRHHSRRPECTDAVWRLQAVRLRAGSLVARLR